MANCKMNLVFYIYHNLCSSIFIPIFILANTTTKAAIPKNPPKTTLGSFEVISHDLQKRKIYVYWSHIPEKEYNGPNFGYVISEVFQANEKR